MDGDGSQAPEVRMNRVSYGDASRSPEQKRLFLWGVQKMVMIINTNDSG